MVVVKIGLFKFGCEEFELRYVIDKGLDVKFVGKDIATMLKYENTNLAIMKHTDEKYRTTYKSIEVGAEAIVGDDDKDQKIVRTNNPLYLQPHTVLVSKSGVIQLIMKSKLPYAVELQEWLFEEVIPQVLCTGKYTPAVESGGNNTELHVNIHKDYQTMIQKKDEQLQQLTVQIHKMAEQKDQVIHRIMNDMNRMYSGFQSTMQKKDEIMAQKDQQVLKMIDKMVDLSDRAVQYPANAKKLPTICVAKTGNTFYAITGQRSYVEQQKHKRRLADSDIIVNTKRPNPTVDWNNIMHEVCAVFDTANVKCSKRSLSFESSNSADKFKNMLQHMLSANVTDKCEIIKKNI
jgi:prophage antirepressor-like protein